MDSFDQRGGEIARRATIADIEASRHKALAMYGEVFDTLEAARKAAADAAPSVGDIGYFDDAARDALVPKYHGYHTDERRAKFLAAMTRQTDTAIWSHLIEGYGLEKLMDKTEREKFRKELRDNPPPATADNCRATLQRLVGDADLIFVRGIAKAFSTLDRRFRSHDGFKIGARVVLERCFSEHGSWNYHRAHDETLRDVERVFCHLDGKEMPERMGGIVGVIDTVRGRGWEAKAWTCQNDYFEVRAFKNGNAHLWFKRKDLVLKVNRMLADYYGESLGVAPDAATKDPFRAGSRAVVKNFGAFNSPPAVVVRVMEHADIKPGMRVLEPSAGTGNLARAALAAGAQLTAVEVQPHLATALAGPRLRVICADFLALQPSEIDPVDVVIMNPPFDNGADIEHVMHALKFLKPGGWLVAITSPGAEYRETAKHEAFRARAAKGLRGYDRNHWDLPEASFASEGTNVNAMIWRIAA